MSLKHGNRPSHFVPAEALLKKMETKLKASQRLIESNLTTKSISKVKTTVKSVLQNLKKMKDIRGPLQNKVHHMIGVVQVCTN